MKGNDPLQTEYESFYFASNTNPYFPPEEFEAARKSLPAMVFNQEYLALPGENQNNPFGTDNINKNIIQSYSTDPTVVYGIDLAKYNDYTVINGMDAKGRITSKDRFQLPWGITQNRINNYQVEY